MVEGDPLKSMFIWLWEGGWRGAIIRGEVVSVPPGARTQRCSKRWQRGGRWWRRRRWPTRSTASAGSPRSCAGSAAPCWCRPRPPTGAPWSWAAARRRAAAARSGARLHDPPLNSLQRQEGRRGEVTVSAHRRQTQVLSYVHILGSVLLKREVDGKIDTSLWLVCW